MRVGHWLALAGYNLPNTTVVFLENIMMIVLQSGHYTIKESASNPHEITVAFCTRLFSWVRGARSGNDEHESFNHAYFLRETSFYLWLVTYVVSTVKGRERNWGLCHSKKPNFQRVGILFSVVFVVLFFLATWRPYIILTKPIRIYHYPPRKLV